MSSDLIPSPFKTLDLPPTRKPASVAQPVLRLGVHVHYARCDFRRRNISYWLFAGLSSSRLRTGKRIGNRICRYEHQPDLFEQFVLVVK